MQNTLFRKTEIETTTYEYKDGFMVDVVLKENAADGRRYWNVWLYHEKYGAKDFVIRLPEQENLMAPDQVVLLMDAGAMDDEIALYIDAHMQEGLWEWEN